ncbi:MAG: nucleoside deaminase [Microthrixaceae bacterium]
MRPSNPILEADSRHEDWMDLAIEQATFALDHDDVPIGAVVVQFAEGSEPTVIAARHNERELTGDPTAHAEVLALRDAAEKLGRWRLDDCQVIVTLEPCPMCAGAMWASRLSGLVFGTDDPKAGAVGSLYNLAQDPRLNHEFAVRAGVRRDECSDLLVSFFAQRRDSR